LTDDKKSDARQPIGEPRAEWRGLGCAWDSHARVLNAEAPLQFPNGPKKIK